MNNKPNNLQIDMIIRYEQGELSDPEIVDLFQDLIDTGIVWELQGHYVHTAIVLLGLGECRSAKTKHPNTMRPCSSTKH